MKTQPYWMESVDLPQFPALSSDLQVDVVVIGGGLTGITTAYLLKKAGAKVALLERQRCAAADTGRTTAHLTYVTDERLHHLVKTFGKDGAKAFWEAGVAAIDQISEIVRSENIDCEFKWVSGFLHAQLADEVDKDEIERLEADADFARQFGFEAALVQKVPYANRPGVRFAHQAKFHPRKYLGALLPLIPGAGSHVFENTAAENVEANPLTVHAGPYKIRC